MRAERGEVWQVDFVIAAKVRPALPLTGEPADDQLDLFTVLPHAAALRGNRWEAPHLDRMKNPGSLPV